MRLFRGEPIETAARRELERSDYVAMRCLKAGIAYPDAWKARDETLRAIARGENLKWPPPLPPPYKPNGT